MKLRINKVCDLNSISVLPPQSRRPNTGASASQLRSQQSQQSFSQSQHGVFSQFSQSSLDETLTNDQRFGSQERDNSGRRISRLAQISHPREEGQMPLSISSSNRMQKWNSASHSDYKCHISEEHDQRIGVMETSINRTGAILNSIQSDVMHVNKVTKEVYMEMESIRHKLTMNDSSIQLMNKGQEDIKAILDKGLKGISDELHKSVHEDKLKEIFSVLSALPGQIEECIAKLQNNLSYTFTKEMQALAYRLKTPNLVNVAPTALQPEVTSIHANLQEGPQLIKNVAAPRNIQNQPIMVPKVKTRSLNSVKVEHVTFGSKGTSNAHRQNGAFLIKQERECRVIIDSDDEIDGGFSFLVKKIETDMESSMSHDAKKETDRILKNARRRKRKYSNTIFIN